MKLPVPSPSRIDTIPGDDSSTSFPNRFTTARSSFPLPRKSPTAIEYGPLPTVTMGVAAGEKLPVPSPSRIETVLSWKLATARSRTPSPLKSPTAMANGSEDAPLPTNTGEPGNGVKFPAPSPFSSVTVPV